MSDPLKDEITQAAQGLEVQAPDHGSVARRGRRRLWYRRIAPVGTVMFVGIVLATTQLVDSTPTPPTGTMSRGDVIAAISTRQEGGGGIRPFNSLTGLLENTEYKVGDASPRPLTEAVIVGRVVDVEPGRGFRVDGDDAPDGIETDFDDPDALWRTVHASVRVESVISGAADQLILVGFAFDPRLPLDDIKKQMIGFGRVLMFLNKSPVFDYDPDVYATVLDGALLGLIDHEGHIALPALEETEEADLLRAASTIDELRAAAEEAPRMIQLDDSGARISP